MPRLIPLIGSTDPSAVGSNVLVYAKDVLGVTQIFARASDGTVSQITPFVTGGDGGGGGGAGFLFPDKDGDLTFDGSTTILGMVPVSNVYTLTRDIFGGTITVNSGITITTVGRRIYGHVITGAGTIENNGGVGGVGAFAVNGAPGAAGIGGTTASGLFGPGIIGAGGDGFSGGSTNTLPVPWGSTVAGGGAGPIAGPGTSPGGVGQGGGGGGSITSSGGTTGGVTADTTAALTPGQLLTGDDFNGTQFTFGGGGGGGSIGESGGYGGGGGGGGGGCVAVVASEIVGTLTIRANGGAGSNGTASNVGGRASSGGGGGGGGGLAIVICNVLGGGVTVQALGGDGGVGGPIGIGTGAGFAGGNGTAGIVITSVDTSSIVHVERLSADGAASPSIGTTFVSGTGTDLTLANGTVDGFVKNFTITGGTGTITPANLADGNVLTYTVTPANVSFRWDTVGITWHVHGVPLNMVTT